jgi:hypothetical protein
MHQIPYMKRANEHAKGVIDGAESNGVIDDVIGGHLHHVRCKKQRKVTLGQEEANTTEVCTRSLG